MRFLITSGGTREYIDPVRFISNASSGKMGHAITQAAFKAGHKATLITTVNRASSITCPPKLQRSRKHRAFVINVETAAQMFEAVKKHFPSCDCLIMAAAVADYTPAHVSKTKIKKQNKLLTIKLKPTVDILRWAGKHKNKSRITGHGSRVIVGFAVEDKNVRRQAEKKLREKGLDMIVANTPDAIGADSACVQIKTPGCKWIKLPKASKTTIAKRIITLAEKINKAR